MLREAFVIRVGKNTIFFTNPFHALVIIFQTWDLSLAWWLQHNTQFRLAPHFLFLFGLIRLRQKWRRIWRLKEFGREAKSTHFTNKINKTSSRSTSPRSLTLILGQQSFHTPCFKLYVHFLPKENSTTMRKFVAIFFLTPLPHIKIKHTSKSGKKNLINNECSTYQWNVGWTPKQQLFLDFVE